MNEKNKLCGIATQAIVRLILTHLLRAFADVFSSSAELCTMTTPETEMEFFFARNCYTESERKRVKTWRPYQAAMERNDLVEAQEIAMRVLEQGLGTSPESSPRHPFAQL